MDIQKAIATLIEEQHLTTEEMTDVMRLIMTGEATPAQIGGFLIALRMKGETVAEIAAAANVMRELSHKVELDSLEHVVDTCGTGGDGSKLFNVSTAASFVVAAAGGKVAKHGNRSVSSKSGSADLLEHAGVNLTLTPEQVQRCIEEIGVGFMFAQNHHSAMKHAIGPRKEMAVRTIFNLLGPLTNPAGTKRQVMGVFDKQWLRPIAEVLQRLGSEHVMVVHSEDGLDEISIAAPTHVAELKDGKILEYTISPQDFNLEVQPLASLQAENTEESLTLVKQALEGKGTVNPARDIVALNAGAAIYVAGLANDFAEGVVMAEDVIGAGLANIKLAELASMTQCYQVEG